MGKDAPVFALNTVKKLTSELSVLKTIHAALSKAQQETNLSNTNLARLKPAYDTIIRP